MEANTQQMNPRTPLLPPVSPDDTWASPKPLTRGCNRYHNDAPCSVEGSTFLLTKTGPWQPPRSHRPQPRLWHLDHISQIHPFLKTNNSFFYCTILYIITCVVIFSESYWNFSNLQYLFRLQWISVYSVDLYCLPFFIPFISPFTRFHPLFYWI